MALLEDVILEPDTRANQPAANTVPVGTLYCVTDESDILERSNGAAWEAYSPGAAGGGTVTNTGTLTDHAVIVGNGGVDVSAIATGTAGQFLESAGAGADPAFAFSGLTLIEQLTPTATGTVTFSSLGTFTHLQIVWAARSTEAATESELRIRFNADSGNNYSSQEGGSVGVVPIAAGNLGISSGRVGYVAAGSQAAGVGSSGVINIQDYRGTTLFKSVVASGSTLRAADYVLSAFASTWSDASAVTSITLLLDAGNYDTGSKITLYGLR